MATAESFKPGRYIGNNLTTWPDLLLGWFAVQLFNPLVGIEIPRFQIENAFKKRPG